MVKMLIVCNKTNIRFINWVKLVFYKEFQRKNT